MPASDDSSAASSQSYTKILQGRYELGRVLGRGGSSKVYRARDVRTGAYVAVKAVRKPRHPCSPEDLAAARRSVEREILALRRVQGHPHVARLLDVLASRSAVYIVLDLASGGTVLSEVERYGAADEPGARLLFGQLVSALAHAHARDVFHRDVKPENLLLDERGDLRLTDFGLCAFADGGQLCPHGLAATACGTPAYVAPEILLKRRYDPRMADVWSCGVVLFVLTAGYLPFIDGNLMAMYLKVCAGRFRCLIGRMLDPDPDTRIKIGEILDHPWLQHDGVSSFGKIPVFRSRQTTPDEVVKWEEELEQSRELNAFDIRTFASGCDLTGLIRPLPDRVRFLVPGVDARSVLLDNILELGKEDGFSVRRNDEGGHGGVLLEAIDGRFVAQVKVHRLHEEIMMVEAERANADVVPSFWKELQSIVNVPNQRLMNT
jgi:carbon catabolite-derepressing protein kinase